MTDIAPPPLPEGRFAGRSDFQQLVRDALACAAREGWREIVLTDASFADWPLGERAVIESLEAWAGHGRHLTLIAQDFGALVRAHPRFVTWRTTWSHIIEARVCRNAGSVVLPSAVWSPSWVLQRLDIDRCEGWSGCEPERRQALRELIDEWVRKSAPGFPATTLGL